MYVCMYVCYSFLLCAHLQHSVMIQLYCISKQWVNSPSLEFKNWNYISEILTFSNDISFTVKVSCKFVYSN